jgi:hypothetical protein
MATQSPQTVEPPRVRWDEVIIPFRFLDLSRIDELDLFPGRAHYLSSGSYPDGREPRPQDPFTAWVTMAHLGLIEKGVVHSELDPDLDREQRLAAAFELLTDEELLIVETIAVPKRYREMSAQELAEMVRTAASYIDRMWAACWLTLVGWTESEECTFRDLSDAPQGVGDELEETVIEACAESVNDIGAEVKLIGRRLGICATHYSLNGPPLYECMRDTVPLGPEWEQVIRIVPKKRS